MLKLIKSYLPDTVRVSEFKPNTFIGVFKAPHTINKKKHNTSFAIQLADGLDQASIKSRVDIAYAQGLQHEQLMRVRKSKPRITK